jgi:hypothetical protein
MGDKERRSRGCRISRQPVANIHNPCLGSIPHRPGDTPDAHMHALSIAGHALDCSLRAVAISPNW